MMRSYRSPSGRYEILGRRASDNTKNSQRFVDRDEAERFVRRMMSGDRSDLALRRFALGENVSAGKDMIADLAQEIATGELKIVRARSLVTDPPEEEKPEKPKGEDKPKPPPKKPKKDETAELLAVVKDADGKPVKDVEVQVSRQGKKKTDKDGKADFGKVKPGKYNVTAEKPGHSPEKGGEEGKDKKKAVEAPDGKKTTVNLVQHPLCANVTFFEGPKDARSKYYGFDHKTMMPAKPTDRYWDPVPAHGALSAHNNKKKRDGTRVVSVAVGKEVELEINFDFKDKKCVPCIQNTSFETDPDGKVEVVTTKVTDQKASFKIKGLAVGETVLKAKCDGNDIGWFHIWCETETTLKVDFIVVKSKRATGGGYDLAKMKAAFEEIFRQALVNISVRDLGEVDLSDDDAFGVVEAQGYPASGRFLSKEGSDPTPYSFKKAIIQDIHTRVTAELAKSKTLKKPRAGAYRLYHYVPDVGAAIGGTAIRIGGDYAYNFGSDGDSTRNSFAHEFGHLLGLHHPAADGAEGQLAKHCFDSTDEDVPAYAKTNTEPASDARTNTDHVNGNVMSLDPTNLMGYWKDKANRKPLRYQQWKVIRES